MPQEYKLFLNSDNLRGPCAPPTCRLVGSHTRWWDIHHIGIDRIERVCAPCRWSCRKTCDCLEWGATSKAIWSDSSHSTWDYYCFKFATTVKQEVDTLHLWCQCYFFKFWTSLEYHIIQIGWCKQPKLVEFYDCCVVSERCIPDGIPSGRYSEVRA